MRDLMEMWIRSVVKILIPSLTTACYDSCSILQFRFDNHYAYDGFTYLDDVLEKIKKHGYTYFIWKMASDTVDNYAIVRDTRLCSSFFWRVCILKSHLILDAPFRSPPNTQPPSTTTSLLPVLKTPLVY